MWGDGGSYNRGEALIWGNEGSYNRGKALMWGLTVFVCLFLVTACGRNGGLCYRGTIGCPGRSVPKRFLKCPLSILVCCVFEKFG